MNENLVSHIPKYQSINKITYPHLQASFCIPREESQGNESLEHHVPYIYKYDEQEMINFSTDKYNIVHSPYVYVCCLQFTLTEQRQ